MLIEATRNNTSAIIKPTSTITASESCLRAPPMLIRTADSLRRGARQDAQMQYFLQPESLDSFHIQLITVIRETLLFIYDIVVS